MFFFMEHWRNIDHFHTHLKFKLTFKNMFKKSLLVSIACSLKIKSEKCFENLRNMKQFSWIVNRKNMVHVKTNPKFHVTIENVRANVSKYQNKWTCAIHLVCVVLDMCTAVNNIFIFTKNVHRILCFMF